MSGTTSVRASSRLTAAVAYAATRIIDSTCCALTSCSGASGASIGGGSSPSFSGRNATRPRRLRSSPRRFARSRAWSIRSNCWLLPRAASTIGACSRSVSIASTSRPRTPGNRFGSSSTRLTASVSPSRAWCISSSTCRRDTRPARSWRSSASSPVTDACCSSSVAAAASCSARSCSCRPTSTFASSRCRSASASAPAHCWRS